MKTIVAFGLAAALLMAGCSAGENRSVGVYVLLNAADIHSLDGGNARQVIHYLLQSLQPTDTLAAASIGTARFNETDIIAAVTFDQRPSIVNDQKRAFRDRFDHFVQSEVGSQSVDISGGMLQAIETLNQSNPGCKAILILSNLGENTSGSAARDVLFQMAGFDVVILEMNTLWPDPRDMKRYLSRVESLRMKVEGGGGLFHIINDLQQLQGILKQDPKTTGA